MEGTILTNQRSLLTKLKPTYIYAQPGKTTVISNGRGVHKLCRKKKLIIPFFTDVITLEKENLEIPLNVITMSCENIRTKFIGEIHVALSTKENILELAVKNFGNKSQSEIELEVKNKSEYIVANYFEKKKILDVTNAYFKGILCLNELLENVFIKQGIEVKKFDLHVTGFEVL